MFPDVRRRGTPVVHLHKRPEREPMDQTVPETSTTGPLRRIDKTGLDKLIAERKADPNIVKTSKCKTIAEGRFRHLNFIRTFPAYVVDEPPALLGDDTAPNPSEVALAALGSC